MGNKIIHYMTFMVKSTVIVKILEGWHNARLQ